MGQKSSSAAGSASAGAHGAVAAPPPAPVPEKQPTKKACLDDFVLLKTVGKGSFGKVVQVRKKDDGKIYAMKVLKKEMILKRKQYEHTLSERRVLEQIEHPFIVTLRFAFQTEHKLYMVFDFFNGGELYHYLSEGGRFTEARAKFYAAEIISALGYLHDRGIVYRDLKPENLILDSEGHIRIADFGLSKQDVKGQTVTSICGTPEYLAPEILRRKAYGVTVDWWALGTLLFEMIAGLPPFYDRNRQTMYRKILEAPLVAPPFMSREAVDLCARMLHRDPTRRLGFNGCKEIKDHPFFADIDWRALDQKRITPPWLPNVTNSTDTSNIAKEFTSEIAGITPSPAGVKLKDRMDATPPSFKDFTFTEGSNLRDGMGSYSDDEAHALGSSGHGKVASAQAGTTQVSVSPIVSAPLVPPPVAPPVAAPAAAQDPGVQQLSSAVASLQV